MIFRKIREHSATHNWFAVAIDLAIVVIGVFLGIQASNWNTARIERSQAYEYRERLIADLRANETDLLNRRKYFSEIRKHAQSALISLGEPAKKDDSPFLVDAYFASQIMARQLKRFTYDELLSTGRFNQIGDAAMRERIADYYVRLEAVGDMFNFVPPYRDHIRELMPNRAQQAIREQCGTLIFDVKWDCAVVLEPAEVNDAVAAIRASPLIGPGLTRLIADMDLKLTLVESLLAHERNLRNQLET